MNELDKMAVADRFLRTRILGLSWWLAPAKKKEISDRLVSGGFNAGSVALQIERLEIAKAIKTTENYCFVSDADICSQAGRRIMPEILAELGGALE